MMNKIEAVVKEIHSSGNIKLIDLEARGIFLSALLTDSPYDDEWVEKGKRVFAVFKETEVSLAKDLSGRISMRNRMVCLVTEIKKGELLSLVKMDFNGSTLVSAITTRSVESMEIGEGDEITALIKANEISIMRI